MSRIVKWIDGPVLGGHRMPWGHVIIEGTKFLICSGETGRDPNLLQEWPEMAENENFETPDQAARQVCPRTIEEQTILALEQIKKNLQTAGTSFDNVYQIRWYVTERYLVPRMYRTALKWFKKENPEFAKTMGKRAQTLLIVKGLDHPDMLVEIEMHACVPE